MTTFDEREQAFERKFVHDEDLAFRALARRDRKLGLWAAHLLGRSGEAAEAYADALVLSEVADGDQDAMVRTLLADFEAGGVARSEPEIRRQMDVFLIEARTEVMAA